MWCANSEEAYYRLQSLVETSKTLQAQVNQSPWVEPLWSFTQKCLKQIVLLVEEEESLLQQYLQQADMCHYLLKYVEAASADRIPHSILLPMRSIVRQYGIDVEILVWRDWMPGNYTTTLGLTKKLRKMAELLFTGTEQKEILDSLPEMLSIVSTPASDKDNILQHSSIAHEIGHALNVHYDIINKCQFKLNQVKFDKAVEDEMAARSSAGSQQELFLKITIQEEISKTVLNWIDEILADVWGIRITGPSSMLTFIHNVGPQQASNSHPPSYLRGTAMKQALLQTKFIAAPFPNEMRWLTPSLHEFEHQMLSTKVSPGLGPARLFAQSTVEGLIPELVNRVINMDNIPPPFCLGDWLKGYVTIGSWFKDDDASLHAMIEKILFFSCPCWEVGSGIPQHSSVASILLAGWNVRLDSDLWDIFTSNLCAKTNEEKYQALKKMYQLIHKALELDHLMGFTCH